jgi:Carbohydrate family 9 binding domain-like
MRAVIVVTLMIACAPAPSPRLLTSRGVEPLHDPAPTLCDAVVDDRLQLLSLSAPTSWPPGSKATLTTTWRVKHDLLGTDPMVFVHVTAPGGEVNLLQADHPPLQRRVAPMLWRVGDVIVDEVELTLPSSWPARHADIRIGWYEGKHRWPVRGSCDVAVVDERLDRIQLPSITVTTANDHVDIPHLGAAVVIDGVREPSWAAAAVLGPFAPWDGKGKPQHPTTAYAQWDEDALYLLFVATDPDPHSPYHNNDDPLYEGEALELFIDGDGDGNGYIEVQANIHDAHFDASFFGGSRQGMDIGFSSGVVTTTVHHDGVTVSEWRLPWTAVADHPVPLANGVVAANLFRLERVRGGAQQRLEASAWRSPLSGDFHNLARFGRFRLVP